MTMTRFHIELVVLAGLACSAEGRSKVVVRSASAEKCQAFIDRLPYVIVKPGSYCIQQELAYTNATTHAIQIKSDDVEIIGQKHCLSGSVDPTTPYVAIQSIDYKRVTIQDVCIHGFKVGIEIGSSANDAPGCSSTLLDGETCGKKSHNIIIRDNSIESATFKGIGVTADSVEIVANRITSIGGTRLYPHSFATGIYVTAQRCRVAQNHIFGLFPNDSGEGVGIALYEGNGCTVVDNLIDSERWPYYGRIYGIWTRAANGEYPVVENNTIRNAHYALGPWGVMRDNILSGIACRVYVDRVAQPMGGQWFAEKTGKNFAYRGPHLGEDPKNGRREEIESCRDIPELAMSRAIKTGDARDAFSVAMAYSETDQSTYAEQIVTWLWVAKHLGHELADKFTKDLSSWQLDTAAEKRIDRDVKRTLKLIAKKARTSTRTTHRVGG